MGFNVKKQFVQAAAGLLMAAFVFAGCSGQPAVPPDAAASSIVSKPEEQVQAAVEPVSNIVSIDVDGSKFDIDLNLDTTYSAARLTTERPTPVTIQSASGYDVEINGEKAVPGTPVQVQLEKLSVNDGFDILFTNQASGEKKTVRVQSYPSNGPLLRVKPKDIMDGYYYFSVDRYLYKMNSLGELVFYWNVGQYCLDFKRVEIGDKVYYTTLHATEERYNSPHVAMVMDENYYPIEKVPYLIPTDKVRPNSSVDNHQFMMLDIGHYIVSCYYNKWVDNIPDDVPHSPFGSRVTATIIQEIKDGEVVWEWDSTDHPELYGMSMYSNDYFNDRELFADYMHFNSITVDPADNNYVCSMRNLSAVIKIDRATGEVLWVLGGKGDQFGLTEEQKPGLQHFASVTPEGTITIFDNGVGKDKNGDYNMASGLSRAIEYKIDEANKKLLSYNAYPVDNQYSYIMGSAQKLSSDPVVFLMGWGGRKTPNALLSEIDFTNQKRLFEIAYIIDGFEQNTYRAYKFDK